PFGFAASPDSRYAIQSELQFSIAESTKPSSFREGMGLLAANNKQSAQVDSFTFRPIKSLQ
ncbi:MAG TPA: hypothetical protein VGJ69_12055, partial [Pyrinomonadaceae bacterium]